MEHNTAVEHVTRNAYQEGVSYAQSVFIGVFQTMSFGLIISFLVAVFVASSGDLINAIVGNRSVFLSLVILQVAAVVGLSLFIAKISGSMAKLLFYMYSVLSGLTLSVIFLVYQSMSIIGVFIGTASMFGALTAYGYTTKRNLDSLGAISFAGLIGVIASQIVNHFFLKSPSFDTFLTVAGILIFTGLTMYDVRKIRVLAASVTDEESADKVKAVGALTLYLDFINLFLKILSLAGKRK